MNSSIPRSSDKKPSGRPTLDESLERRKALLAAAMEEFLQHGFEGANIDAIARKAGVGRATVYRQFGSKEQLYRAATNTRSAAIQADLRAVIAQPWPPQDILRAIIEQIYEAFTSSQIMATVRLSVAEAERFPDLSASTYEAETQGALQPVVEYLQRLRSEGVLDIGDPVEATEHLVNMAYGGIRFLLNRPLPSAEARQHWVDSVMRMILPAFKTPA